MSRPGPGFGSSSTLPLLIAFVLALAFLGVVVAIGLSDGPDGPAAASTTATTAGPLGDLPTPLVTLTLDTAGEGKGTVRVAGLPRVCTQECRFRIDQDTSVTIIARAAPGSTFVTWTGSCGGGRICTVTMDRARRATALFSVPSAAGPLPKPEPDCADDIDNDGDGYVDDADVECFTGDNEAPADDPVSPAPPDDTIPPPVAQPPPVVIPPPPPPPVVIPPPDVPPSPDPALTPP